MYLRQIKRCKLKSCSLLFVVLWIFFSFISMDRYDLNMFTSKLEHNSEIYKNSPQILVSDRMFTNMTKYKLQERSRNSLFQKGMEFQVIVNKLQNKTETNYTAPTTLKSTETFDIFKDHFVVKDLFLNTWSNKKTVYTAPTTLNSTETFEFFKDDFVVKDPFLNTWSNKKTVLCNGKFQGYANLFVFWKNITIDSSKSRGAYGGEAVSQVLKQKETIELLNPMKGFFSAECKLRPKYTFLKYFENSGHLPTWLNVLSLTQVNKTEIISNFTVLIPRNEYANMYHSLNDIFNVFLLHIFFHKDPSDSVIIFADGHPKGNIDGLWKMLFGNILRVRHLQNPIHFSELIWPMSDRFSPLNLFDLKQVSYIDHFRTFVFKRYGIIPKPQPNCGNISILFIWRHDYLAHPRNPKGKLTRKIWNEEELFNITKTYFPNLIFRSADLARLSIKEQLDLISKTDIIIAMHGAGLVLELFLLPTGGVIELIPRTLKGFTKKQYDLFKVITDRIPLHYIRWQNKDIANEVEDGYTYVPPVVVTTHLEQMLSKMCNKV